MWTSNCCGVRCRTAGISSTSAARRAMMQSLVPALAEWGVAAQDIHHEAFGPASVRLHGRQPDEPVDRQRGAGNQIRALRPHARLGWPGRQPARLCRAPRRGRGFRLSVGQLRQLRNEADFRQRALRTHAGPRRARQAIACCAWASRRRRWCSRPDAMPARLLSREVLPFFLSLAALVLAALLLDALLHLADAVWIGRYLGHPRYAADPGVAGLFAAQAQAHPVPASPASCCAGTRPWPGWARCWCWCMPASTSIPSWAGWRWGRC